MERCARPFCGHIKILHHNDGKNPNDRLSCFVGWDDESGAMPCDCDRYLSPDHARAMAGLKR